MHGFLMIVAAEHEIDAHFGVRAKDALRVFEPMPSRQLAHHRIMVHDDNARITRSRSLEFGTRPLELVASQIADDRNVSQIPRQRSSRDTLRRVETDDRHPRYV